MAEQLVNLDGNYLEGGGQIVRTALALSALTQKPFRLTDIRKGRDNPGLKPQHLTALTVLKEFCNADVEGDTLGSSTLTFIPKGFKPKSREIDIGTAGSVSLLMQSLLPALVLHNKKIKLVLKGGTDAKWAMPIDYFHHVFLPQLRPYADIICTLLKRGYYPKGGGEVELSIKPKFEFSSRGLAPGIQLTDFKKILQIKGVSHAAKSLQSQEVAERTAKTADLALKKLNVPVNIAQQYVDTLSPGSGIVLWALCSQNEEFDFHHPILLGSDGLGEKGKRSEDVGMEAANRLIKELQSKAAVDSHSGDNLIPFLGLFGGELHLTEVTKHTLTNIYTVEQFLGNKFSVEGNVIKQEKQA